MSTVVLSGSLGSNVTMWGRQARVLLEAGFAVGVVEHPGHGDEPVFDFDDVGGLARAKLDEVGRGRFSFVGVSLGGAVGIQLALDAPARIGRLVLICASARFGEPGPWLDRAATVRERGLEAIVDNVLERWFTPAFADVRRYREMFLATDPEGYARCCETIARWDVRDELARVEAPTLVVSGADDPATPPEHGELLAERIPDARHVVVANARHLAPVERPDEVNSLILEHLT